MEENEKKALKTLEETRQAWAVIVNRYIKKLQKENEELKEIVNKNHETMLDKRYVEMNFVSKDKIYDLKERILLLLDDNRVPSPYLAGIREYFEDLLKEN